MMPPQVPELSIPMSAPETTLRWPRHVWTILKSPEITIDGDERMSQYLDDQSSIARYSHVAQDR